LTLVLESRIPTPRSGFLKLICSLWFLENTAVYKSIALKPKIKCWLMPLGPSLVGHMIAAKSSSWEQMVWISLIFHQKTPIPPLLDLLGSRFPCDNPPKKYQHPPLVRNRGRRHSAHAHGHATKSKRLAAAITPPNEPPKPAALRLSLYHCSRPRAPAPIPCATLAGEAANPHKINTGHGQALLRDGCGAARPPLRHAQVCAAAQGRGSHGGAVGGHDEDPQRRHRREVGISTLM
jgi:hypothetical protein